jgi:hypothetical protein
MTREAVRAAGCDAQRDGGKFETFRVPKQGPGLSIHFRSAGGAKRRFEANPTGDDRPYLEMTHSRRAGRRESYRCWRGCAVVRSPDGQIASVRHRTRGDAVRAQPLPGTTRRTRPRAGRPAGHGLGALPIPTADIAGLWAQRRTSPSRVGGIRPCAFRVVRVGENVGPVPCLCSEVPRFLGFS